MKRILVIGANSAIAAACARRWAALAECHFYLLARDETRLAQTAEDLRARGARVDTARLDVNDLDAQAGAIQAAVAALGEINVALLAHGTLPDQAACEQDAALALREFSTNATATLGLLTVLANQLEKQQHGTLAVISSVAGVRGRPSNYLYGSAKAAVSTFCEGLRVRLHHAGAHVVDIRPGFIDTPMTRGLDLPAALLRTPEQAAVRIVAGVERRADVLYVPAFWALIMWVIRHLPRFIFRKMKL